MRAISNTTGNNNTFLGWKAGYSNTTGGSNIAIGAGALYSNSTGASTVAIGQDALHDITTQGSNVAVGYSVLRYTSSGDYNTAVGNSAGFNNTTGLDNSFFSFHAGFSNTTGSRNSFVGLFAGASNNTGSFNAIIGWNAGITNFDNSIAIGNAAVSNASNKAVIGNFSVSVIGGQVGWSTFSDGRFKKDVKQNVPGLRFINKLKPVTYFVESRKIEKFLGLADNLINNIKNNYGRSEQKLRTGFVAQDVEKAAEEIGYDFSGLNKPQNEKDNYSLVYADFVPSLVKSVQELSAMVDKKDADIETLQKENKQQQQLINTLITRLDKIEQAMTHCCSAVQQPPVSGSALIFTAADEAKLEQNVPNPFSNDTYISYYVPAKIKQAKLIITDMNNRQLKVQAVNTGYGKLTIQAGSLAAGTYIYSLYGDGKLIDSKKMILVR